MTLALPFTRKADGTESKAVPAAVRLCSDHLRKFTEDPDQNLKYLVSTQPTSTLPLGMPFVILLTITEGVRLGLDASCSLFESFFICQC